MQHGWSSACSAGHSGHAICASLPLTALSLTALAAGAGGSSTANVGQGNGPGITNHPVHVIPSETVVIPSGWPLSDRGAITCLTCHTEIATESEQSGPKLRDFESEDARSGEFCAKCHGRAGHRSASSTHWIAVQVAHLPGDRADPRGGSSLLDTGTRRCLSCHDGASAIESKNVTPWTHSRGYVGDKRRSHPVGVLYGDPSRPKDLSPLRPASSLPQGVALPDGKVGCISCHNLYAGTRHLLTVPIQGSELCLTCHDMR